MPALSGLTSQRYLYLWSAAGLGTPNPLAVCLTLASPEIPQPYEAVTLMLAAGARGRESESV
ncbi:hypothetical protein SBA3_5050005 [Candidatus Sulfopaludibacter sp. SbA3]|nr:hypothetical protein SBA3_5050005 [Candidatus Sulfopaludibacter sp. SbA3]